MFPFAVHVLWLFLLSISAHARRTGRRVIDDTKLRSVASGQQSAQNISRQTTSAYAIIEEGKGRTPEIVECAPLSKEERMAKWACEWCEKKFSDEKSDVWLLHDLGESKPEEIGSGGYFHVFKVRKYECPEVTGAFLKPGDEHAADSAQALANYQDAAQFVKGIPGMLEPVAFAPIVGTHEEQKNGQGTWSHGIIFPLMQGSLQDWMTMTEDRGLDKVRKGCLPKIATWLVDVVHELHLRKLAHCDIKPENVLIRYGASEGDCPHMMLADYDGLARPGRKCNITTEQYAKPVGDETPGVIDWRETFASLVEIYDPGLSTSGAMWDMFGDDDWDDGDSFTKTTYEKAVDYFENMDDYGGDNEALKQLHPLLNAILAAAQLDEADVEIGQAGRGEQLEEFEAAVLKEAHST